MKKRSSFGFLLLVFVIAFLLLWSYKFWPFSTGGNSQAFLGTTFGMSIPEVRRSLKKNGAELLDHDKFKNLDPELNNKVSFIEDLFISYEEQLFVGDKFHEIHEQSLYMPSIEMFNSEVVAEFTFLEKKLSSVEIAIYPFSNSDVTKIIKNILETISPNYQLIDNKKTSETNYSLTFKNKLSELYFAVNLDEKNGSPINITMDNSAYSFNESKIKKRELKPF